MTAVLEREPKETSTPRQPTPGEIIAKHQQKAPVHIVAIAEELGINVWEMHDLPEGFSGKIWKDPLNGGGSGYSIGVRASDPIVRKRFTVAHEVAHFILHRNQLDGCLLEDIMYRGGLSNRQETQANQMAADILMPFSLINRLMKAKILLKGWQSGCKSRSKL
jgi:hypothetical protein